MVAADLHRVRGVARQLGELSRGGGAQRAHVARVEVNGDAVHRRACVAEQLQRFVVGADLDAHFAQEVLGVMFHRVEPLLAEELVRRDRPGDECGARRS